MRLPCLVRKSADRESWDVPRKGRVARLRRRLGMLKRNAVQEELRELSSGISGAYIHHLQILITLSDSSSQLSLDLHPAQALWQSLITQSTSSN